MKKEVMKQISALVVAAFGLVAALAWNDTIKEIFRVVFGEQSTVSAMLVYAILVTIIAVVVTIWVAKASERYK